VSYALRTTGSGLVVADEAMDEARVDAALKRLDRSFSLQKRRDDGELVEVYKVVKYVSDTLAPVVFTWVDEHGRPLPLSHALVDEFRRHMIGERTDYVSEDEHNRRLVEERRRDARREADAVLDDHRPYVERGRVSVSLADTGKKRYWQREGKIPVSGVKPGRGR
jgi:hypothetical protein